MPTSKKDLVPVTCPKCGHEQPEPRGAYSTVCKSCKQHFRIQEVLHATAPALNEEISFRGLMYTAIAELAGPGAAVTISTGLFTAIHFGYQRSWNAYPGMVLVGLAFAVLRRRGASLGWLILMHFAIDATWFGYGFRLGYGGPAYLCASWVIKTLGVLIAWRWPLMRRS